MKKAMYILIPALIVVLVGFLRQYNSHEKSRIQTKVWTGQSNNGLWRVEYKNNQQRLGARDPENTCAVFLYYEGDNKEKLKFVSYEFRKNGVLACHHENIDLVFPYEFCIGGQKPEKEDNYVLYLKRKKENEKLHKTEIEIDTQNFQIERDNSTLNGSP